MIRLFLTLALLLALPAQATINAASFQRTASLCADGTRNVRYPAGGASCSEFPPSPSPDYVRRWDDGVSSASTAENIDGLSDIDVTKPPDNGGFSSALYPWARTIIDAGTLEDGRPMFRVENRSNYLDAEGRRRYEIQVAEGTAVQFAEIGVPHCYGYPIRFNTGPYGDGKSWYAASNWVITSQLSPEAAGSGPIAGLYVRGQGTGATAGKISFMAILDEGATKSGAVRHSWYYDPNNPDNQTDVRGAELDKIYWMVWGVVADPLNTGVGRLRMWITDAAERKADPATGTTRMMDYVGRVGFGNYASPGRLRKKTGIYFVERAGASYQSDTGTIYSHAITTSNPADNAAALDTCRDIIHAAIGLPP